MPCRVSSSTWSFISAMKGDTTSVAPGSSNADNGKASDLPTRPAAAAAP